MAEEVQIVEVDEEELDVVDTLIDIVSIGGGVVAGAGVVYGLQRIIPAAQNAVETVFRTVGISVAGVATQYIGTKAINDDLNETRAIIHGLASRGSSLFDKE